MNYKIYTWEFYVTLGWLFLFLKSATKPGSPIDWGEFFGTKSSADVTTDCEIV